MKAYILEFSSRDTKTAAVIGRAGPFEQEEAIAIANDLKSNGRVITVLSGSLVRTLFDSLNGVPCIDLEQQPKTPAILTAIRDGQVWINGPSLKQFFDSSVTQRISANILKTSPTCCGEHIGEHQLRGVFAMMVSASGLVPSDFLQKAEPQEENIPSGKPPKENAINLDRLHDAMQLAFEGPGDTSSRELAITTSCIVQNSPGWYYYAVVDFYADGLTVVRSFGRLDESTAVITGKGCCLSEKSEIALLIGFPSNLLAANDYSFRAGHHIPSIAGRLLTEVPSVGVRSELGEECVVFEKSRSTHSTKSVLYDEGYWITKLFEKLLDPNQKLKVTKYPAELSEVSQWLINGLFDLIPITDRLPSGSLSTKWGRRASWDVASNAGHALVQCVAGCLAAREAKRLMNQREDRLRVVEPVLDEAGTPAGSS